MIKLGQKLHDQRIRKGLTLDDVTRETKIRPVFLMAIERGEYNKLPASSYAQGFVANYAEFLGISRKEALALFRREFDEAKVFAIIPERFSHPADSALSRFKIQQTALFMILAFIALLIYVSFSYKDAFLNPSLTIYSPKENVVSSGTFIVKGKANPDDTVIINNSPVFVDEKGMYEKTITAFPGKTTITVTSTNRFGRFTTIKKIIDVRE